jgi:hypothetical protein
MMVLWLVGDTIQFWICGVVGEVSGNSVLGLPFDGRWTMAKKRTNSSQLPQ